METALATSVEADGSLPSPPQPTKAQREWARCRPWLEDALAAGPGLCSIADIEEGIGASRLIFWAGKETAFITRLDEWPNAKVMTICLAGGAVEANIENSERDITRMAEIMGCTHVAVDSDEQHIPMLKDRGFRHAFTTLLKPIAPQAIPAQIEPAVASEPAEETAA